MMVVDKMPFLEICIAAVFFASGVLAQTPTTSSQSTSTIGYPTDISSILPGFTGSLLSCLVSHLN